MSEQVADAATQPCFTLKPYVAGQSPRSQLALANLRRTCAEQLEGRYEIEVIDLLEHPEQAKADQIVALPTPARQSPSPR